MTALSEAHFQRQVEQLAKYYGWRTYHTHDSRRSTPGFPDLVLVRGAELIFAELKTDKGRLRPEQRDWIADLQAVSTELCEVLCAATGAAGIHSDLAMDVYIWRPADFDELHGRLARGRARTEPLYRSAA
jgi:hypothetical protein